MRASPSQSKPLSTSKIAVVLAYSQYSVLSAKALLHNSAASADVQRVGTFAPRCTRLCLLMKPCQDLRVLQHGSICSS